MILAIAADQPQTISNDILAVLTKIRCSKSLYGSSTKSRLIWARETPQEPGGAFQAVNIERRSAWISGMKITNEQVCSVKERELAYDKKR